MITSVDPILIAKRQQFSPQKPPFFKVIKDRKMPFLNQVAELFRTTEFVAIGEVMGTILLYNQNQLLRKQNEKIDNQILLYEVARRSSLNFSLGDVLDQVNQYLVTRRIPSGGLVRS